MKYKLPSSRKQLKFLKQLINTNTTYRKGFLITSEFCQNFNFTKTQITQMLNALNHKGLIHLKPNENPRYPYVEIAQKAFAYIPDLRDSLFQFWLPLLSSCILSTIAIIISLITLIK